MDAVASTPAPTKTVISHPKAQKIDVAKALKLRLQGNTLEEIGVLFDCSPQAVYQSLAKFEAFTSKAEAGTLTAYSENRAELFNAVEAHLTASLLDTDAMAKASLNNRAYAFKQIHEARRLESGQSTNNISVLGKLIHAAEEGLARTTTKNDSTPNESVTMGTLQVVCQTTDADEGQP